MSTHETRPFYEWLRTAMLTRRMSQRHLAARSGVDHSTISRLLLGGSTPSLDTATRLARGLRQLAEDSDVPGYLGVIASQTTDPSARVELAIRSDESLTESEARELVRYYLATRAGRLGVRHPVSARTSAAPSGSPA